MAIKHSFLQMHILTYAFGKILTEEINQKLRGKSSEKIFKYSFAESHSKVKDFILKSSFERKIKERT